MAVVEEGGAEKQEGGKQEGGPRHAQLGFPLRPGSCSGVHSEGCESRESF